MTGSVSVQRYKTRRRALHKRIQQTSRTVVCQTVPGVIDRKAGQVHEPFFLFYANAISQSGSGEINNIIQSPAETSLR